MAAMMARARAATHPRAAGAGAATSFSASMTRPTISPRAEAASVAATTAPTHVTSFAAGVVGVRRTPDGRAGLDPPRGLRPHWHHDTHTGAAEMPLSRAPSRRAQAPSVWLAAHNPQHSVCRSAGAYFGEGARAKTNFSSRGGWVGQTINGHRDSLHTTRTDTHSNDFRSPVSGVNIFRRSTAPGGRMQTKFICTFGLPTAFTRA